MIVFHVFLNCANSTKSRKASKLIFGTQKRPFSAKSHTPQPKISSIGGPRTMTGPRGDTKFILFSRTMNNQMSAGIIALDLNTKFNQLYRNVKTIKLGSKMAHVNSRFVNKL